MKIGITGATGFIGTEIISQARNRGHEIIGFSRSIKNKIPGCVETRLFDMKHPPDVSGCEAIIHLAGESVFGLWTDQKKQMILESRRNGTRLVVDAILKCNNGPCTLVSGSAIGYYGDTDNNFVDESSAAGNGFLAEIAKKWEGEARRVEQHGIRLALLRTPLVLGKNGGAMKVMGPIFQSGLGGILGDGEQWISWIHLKDEAAVALLLVENPLISGPVNACVSQPCTNREFTETLARVLRRPALFKVPEFVIKMSLGDFSGEILDDKKIKPQKLLEFEYRYRYPNLEAALSEIFHSSRDEG